MKFSEVEFTLGDATHTLRAECENKFTGSVLELKLDGRSVALATGAKKFNFFRLILEENQLTVFVTITAGGLPTLELLYDGKALSTDRDQEAFFEETVATAAKSSKVSMLKNALLNFILFTAAGLLVGVFRQGGFSTVALLIGLLCGTVITLIFLIWDLLDMRSTMKNLRRGYASPTEIDIAEEEALEDEVDEEVDPDQVEIPEDSVSFYDRMREEAEEEEKEKDEEEK